MGKEIRALVWLGLAVACFGADGQPGRIAFVSRQGSANHIYLMGVDASGIGSNPTRLTTDTEPENYPSWSPDGKRLAYQRDFNGSGIYVINADGTGPQRLSPTPGFDVTPSWSPDGTKIIYARLHEAPQPNKPPLTDIRVMNADGTGDRAILANTVFSVEPRWSVNDSIVFMSLMNGGTLDVYVINLDGTGLRRLTNGANNGDPVWSPDGSKISFGSDREEGNKLNIFAMNADGSNVVQLTHVDVPYEAGDTNWSSDGKKITFEHDINGMKQSDPNAFAEVWTMNADGSGAATTTIQCSNVGCAPSWQPRKDVVARKTSDAQVVFQSGIPGNPSSPQEIFTMNLDGSNRTQITSDGLNKFLPRFSPDGTQLLYTKFLEGGYNAANARPDVVVYDFASAKETRLTFGGTAFQPVWSPDGKRIAFGSLAGDSLWIMNGDGSNARMAGSPSLGPDDKRWNDFAWSSDDWILFVVGQNTGGCFKTRLDKIRPDGSARTKVTDGGSNCTPAGMEQSGDADPGFSADGKTIYSSRGFPRALAGMPTQTERRLYSFSSDEWQPGKVETDLSLPSPPDCIEGVPKGSPYDARILLFRACAGEPHTGVTLTDATGSYRTWIADGFGPDWNPVRPPTIATNSVVNAGSFLPQVSAGALASVFGTNLATATVSASGPFPTILGGVSVTVNGQAAPIFFVSGGQVNFQVPWETATGSAKVVVNNGLSSNTATVPVLTAAPGLFVGPTGWAIVQNADFSINGPANPAKVGRTVVAYLTGSGTVNPAAVTGGISPLNPLAKVIAEVGATIGLTDSHVAFAGLTPGFVGLLQMNIVLPANLATGDYPLQVRINGESSNSATISITK